MTIEDKIPDKYRLSKMERVNDNLIYLVDYEIALIKLKNTKHGKTKSIRIVILEDEMHENNPGKHNKEYYETCLRAKTKASEKETMEIRKVILKKEITCSFYER